jgi:uncharacterized protein (TIGR03066 family)
MTRVMTSLAALLALTVSVSALAQEKDPKDAGKLVGKWKLVKSSKGDLPAGLSAVIQFDKDGKFKTLIELGDKKQEGSGTWKLDGKKLTVEFTDGPQKGKKETNEVKKLTDDELVTVDDEQVTEEFKKAKEGK